MLKRLRIDYIALYVFLLQKLKKNNFVIREIKILILKLLKIVKQ